MWFREDKNARNGSREKKLRKTKAMGQIHHILRLVRWQQQGEQRRTDIDFTNYTLSIDALERTCYENKKDNIGRIRLVNIRHIRSY